MLSSFFASRSCASCLASAADLPASCAATGVQVTATARATAKPRNMVPSCMRVRSLPHLSSCDGGRTSHSQRQPRHRPEEQQQEIRRSGGQRGEIFYKPRVLLVTSWTPVFCRPHLLSGGAADVAVSR